MAIELKLTIQDDGTVTIKKFRDTTVKSMDDMSKKTDDLSKKTAAFGKTHKGSIGNAVDQIKNLRASYLIAAGAIGATLGVVGGIAMSSANKLANYVEQVTDLADATGISTKTIQVFGEAAKMSGETFQDASQSINLFYRQLGSAKSGSKDAVQTFTNLGISIKDSNGNFKDGETILLEVADKLTLISDKTDRASYLQDLFGRSGIKMSETIERLAKEYNPLLNNLDRFNLLIDDSKRDQVEKYLKTTREWKTAWEGLSQAIGQKVLPVITSLAEQWALYFAAMSQGKGIKTYQTEQSTAMIMRLNEERRLSVKDPQALLKQYGKTPGGETPKSFGFGRGEGKTGETKGKTEEQAQLAWDKEVRSLDEKRLKYLKDIADKKVDFQKKFDDEEQKMRDNKMKRAEEDMELAERELELTKEINEGRADSYFRMGDAIVSVLGSIAQKHREYIALYKGAMVAESLISTYISAQKAYQAVISSPTGWLMGPAAVPLAEAARTTAIISGLANTAMIAAQSFQSGGVLLGGPRAYGSNERWYKGKPGEGVLTEEGVRNVGGGRGIDRINRGKGFGGNNVTVNVSADRFDEDFVRRKLVPTISKVNARMRV